MNIYRLLRICLQAVEILAASSYILVRFSQTLPKRSTGRKVLFATISFFNTHSCCHHFSKLQLRCMVSARPNHRIHLGYHSFRINNQRFSIGCISTTLAYLQEKEMLDKAARHSHKANLLPHYNTHILFDSRLWLYPFLKPCY